MDQKFEKLKSEIRRMKLLLIVLTIAQIAYMIAAYSSFKFWMKLDDEYHVNIALFIFQLGTIAFFIWYVWKKFPGERKQKTNHTLMIVFLGIIGMWLWLPNKRELEKLKKAYNERTCEV